MTELEENLQIIYSEKNKKIIPENIKKGITILGVTGELEQGGIDTSSDNPVTPEDMVEGKEAFVNGEKVVGDLFTVPAGSATFGVADPVFTNPGGDYGVFQILISSEYSDTLLRKGAKLYTNYDISKFFTDLTDFDLIRVSNALDIKADKIKKGEKVLGVEGTYEGSGGSGEGIPLSPTYKQAGSLGDMLAKIPDEINDMYIGQYFFYNCTQITGWPERLKVGGGNADFMFYRCFGITTAPILDTEGSAPLFDLVGTFEECINLVTVQELSGATDDSVYASRLFRGCYNLKNLPVMQLNNCVNLSDAFVGCEQLTDESLDNILETISKMTNYMTWMPKTLQSIGLTNEQAEKCITLSNWEIAKNNGWTTGYSLIGE